MRRENLNCTHTYLAKQTLPLFAFSIGLRQETKRKHYILHFHIKIFLDFTLSSLPFSSTIMGLVYSSNESTVLGDKDSSNGSTLPGLKDSAHTGSTSSPQKDTSVDAIHPIVVEPETKEAILTASSLKETKPTETKLSKHEQFIAELKSKMNARRERKNTQSSTTSIAYNGNVYTYVCKQRPIVFVIQDKRSFPAPAFSFAKQCVASWRTSWRIKEMLSFASIGTNVRPLNRQQLHQEICEHLQTHQLLVVVLNSIEDIPPFLKDLLTTHVVTVLSSHSHSHSHNKFAWLNEAGTSEQIIARLQKEIERKGDR